MWQLIQQTCKQTQSNGRALVFIYSVLFTLVKLYSAATYVFSIPKSCKITYPGTEDAHGINI